MGRWAGVHVRLHVSFLILAVVTVFLGSQMPPVLPLWYGAVGLAILFVGVLVHELGHYLTALHVGGDADEIILWPLGGLASATVPNQPHQELAVAMAGPLANLLVCVLLVPALVLWELAAPSGAKMPWAALIGPFAPPAGPAEFSWIACLMLAFWVNWFLAIINLLPACPLDGGRAMRAVLWPVLNYPSAILAVMWSTQLIAIGLCLGAWWAGQRHPVAWMPMVLLGIFFFFSARQEAEKLEDSGPGDDSLGYDFSQGYTSLERHFDAASGPVPPGPVRKWLENRRETREIQRQRSEDEEERRVDDILARLHQTGMQGLSREERALLNRVSARYRNRHRQ
ncbi:MAG: M50 family metallopeptidase [Pirellulales bacterium]